MVSWIEKILHRHPAQKDDVFRERVKKRWEYYVQKRAEAQKALQRGREERWQQLKERIQRVKARIQGGRAVRSTGAKSEEPMKEHVQQIKVRIQEGKERLRGLKPKIRKTMGTEIVNTVPVAPKAKEPIEALAKSFKKAGFKFYEVGGSIRDSMLGIQSSDADFTTDATPEQTKEILTKSNLGSVFGIGEAFGTVGLHTPDGKKIEITTFRKEVYPTSSRKPVVEFGTELEDDLARRDFTFNAMAKDVLTGQLLDPFKGKEDLEKGVIRTVGNAKERYAEDPLRMMRAVRFASKTGFKLDTEMPEPEKLQNISKERIQEELNKILTSKDPKRGIELLKKYGLMKHIIPEFEKTYGVKQNKYHYADVYGHTTDVVDNASKVQYKNQGDKLVLMLSAMLHDIGKPDTKTGEGESSHFYGHDKKSEEMARGILRDLHYDNDTIDRVAKIVGRHMTVDLSNPTPSVTNKLIRRLGKKDAEILIDLCEADGKATAKPIPEKIKAFRETMESSLPEEKIASPISGKEIMDKFGLPAGKQIGEVKEYLVNKVVEGELKPDDKKKAYSMAKRFIKEKGLPPTSRADITAPVIKRTYRYRSTSIKIGESTTSRGRIPKTKEAKKNPTMITRVQKPKCGKTPHI